MRKLVLLFLLAILPLAASADDQVLIDKIFYFLNADSKTAEVTYDHDTYMGAIPYKYEGDIVIPEKVVYGDTEYVVTSIGKLAFHDKKITSITIPNSVTSIGNYAFRNCSGLSSVNIPDNVTSIGDGAFKGCSSLASINIPDNVASIGDEFFMGCSSLTSIKIPINVTSIGKTAFSGCTGLESIIIPNNVTSIGASAFKECSNLISVTLGNSVTTIGSNAFSNCSGLTSISIPKSVTYIGYCAFDGCSGLTAFHISDVGSWCNINFDYNRDQPSFLLTDPLTFAPHHIYLNGEVLEELVIPDGVTSINDCAFFQCTDLTSVIIPSSVTNIGNYAFYGCNKLISVTIPNQATSIGNYAFYKCTRLISLSIGNSVQTIGDGAFAYCSGISSMIIPNGVTSIGNEAFFRCKGLTSVIMGKNVESIGWGAFCDCESLKTITIPNSVTSLGDNAFSGSTNISTVTIGKKVSFIDRYSFFDISALRNVYCLATEVPTTDAEAFNYRHVNKYNADLHVPKGCIEKYKAEVPWKYFKKIVEIEGDIVSSVELKVTAQEEKGLVRLKFNSVPGDFSYRITRTDENGTNFYYDKKESHYPDNVEYVDIPPAAGAYTYSLAMAYHDIDGEKQVAKSNTVTVTIAEPKDEEKVAQEYGFITGRIVCDKNPPVSGLKIKFSDDVTVNARGTIFSRHRIPVGEKLTMTVSGDPAHNYESATVQVKAKLNTVTIQGTSREEYQPIETDYDLAYCHDLNIVVIGGKHHAKFTVKNMGDYPWEGDVYVEAKQNESLFSEWFLNKPVYKGKAHIDELATGKYGNNSYAELDIVIEGLALEDDTKFKFNFKSIGRWKRDGINDEIMEKPLTILDKSPYDYFPIEQLVPSNSLSKKKWDNRTREDFSCLMLGLSSITPGMEGIIGDFSNYQYRNKMVAFAKEFTGKNDEIQAIKELFAKITEWASGTDEIEVLNNLGFFNVSSLTFGVIKELRNIFLPEKSIFQKLKKDIIVKASDIKKANAMLGNIASVAQAVTCHDKFECIMFCASALYGLAADETIPLGSIMKTYMVAGKTLINAAKNLQVIVHDNELPNRLKANEPRTIAKENAHGKGVPSYNTTCDFKVIVQAKSFWGFWSSTVNFKEEKYHRQISDIVIKGSNTNITTTYLFDLQYMEDGIMLKLRDTGYVILPDGIKPVIDEGTGGGNYGLTKFYMEIHWSNEHVTVIPLNESSNGLDIICGDRGPRFDIGNKKPSLYTITLTTATGKDNMGDNLYLGTNEERE